MTDDKTTQQCWIFQRNPDRFDWQDREKVAAAFGYAKANYVDVSGHVEPWMATRYFREMREGDIAFFWVSGREGGLEGWGKILQSAQQEESGDWRIQVDTRILVRAPISRARIRRGRAMERHALFTGGAAGTNHRCSAAQALELKSLFEEEEFPAPPLEFGEGLKTVFDLVAELKLPKAFSEDSERLLNVAAQVSKAHERNKGEINVATLFFAACEWGRAEGQEALPRELSLLARKVLELSGADGAYEAALGEFCVDPIDLDPDQATYLPANGRFSPSVKSVLQTCAGTQSAQIRLLLLVQTVLRLILKETVSGSFLRRRLPEVFEKGEELLGALLSGSSAYVEQDCWTTDDRLGYFDYACAFENFLKHEKTRAPMTISIQAPWGGGKSSLMRMIQKLIDPNAPELVEKLESQGQASEKSASRATTKDRAKLTFADVEAQLDKPLALERSDTRALSARPSSPLLTSPVSNERPELEIPTTDIPTIWFNAWTFQNHNQVWAGLGSTIIEGLSERLPPEDRQRFRFALNVQRIDKSALLDTIHRHVLNKAVTYLYRGWGLAVMAVTGAIGYLVTQGTQLGAELLALTGFETGSGVMGVAVGVVLGGFSAFKVAQKIELSKPADIKLDKYFNVPDYRAERGFVYDVSEDLKKALNLVPVDPETGQPKPIVIFIDDLDRCPPPKIAELFEAINLFLAGEFPNCIIILGMDSEIVAASLQKQHASVFEHLQSEMGAASLGWRYMDKFVQLPFVVPSIGKDKVEHYMDTLVAAETDSVEISVEAFEAPIPVDKDEAPTSTAAQNEERRLAIKTRIDQQSRDADGLREALNKARIHFSNNPRALKRLANVFRFYMNLRAARQEMDEDVPTIAQIQNWIILMLRWPDFYRWLRAQAYLEQSLAGPLKRGESALARLETLEPGVKPQSDEESRSDETSKSDEKETWWDAFAREFGKETKAKSWFKPDDHSLEKFFNDMRAEADEGSLAKGAGRGFW